MTADTLRQYVVGLTSHVTFWYRGQQCGIDPISKDQYDLWCGDNTITVTSIDAVMNAPVFLGATLRDIAAEIVDIEY